MKSRLGGYIYPGYDPLFVADAATSVTATGGAESATVTFTAPTNTGGGAITGYVVSSTPEGFSADGSESPITVQGLPGRASYTFTVWAINKYGVGAGSSASNTVPVSLISKGLVVGTDSNDRNSIEYITVASTGNGTDFGDLIIGGQYLSAAGSSARGLFVGGSLSAGVAGTNAIQYVTPSSTGDARDFGDLVVDTNWSGGCGNNITALFGGGLSQVNTRLARIQKVTVASLGNATDFGSLTFARSQMPGTSSSTRAVWMGGNSGGSPFPGYDIMDYVTIASEGNAIDFGNLTMTPSGDVGGLSGVISSGTRGIVAGGFLLGTSNVIHYITISTLGDSVDFGDLIIANYQMAGASSQTRGCFLGGDLDKTQISYITIATTGNATDFGDLQIQKFNCTGYSNDHGGLA